MPLHHRAMFVDWGDVLLTPSPRIGSKGRQAGPHVRRIACHAQWCCAAAPIPSNRIKEKNARAAVSGGCRTQRRLGRRAGRTGPSSLSFETARQLLQ
jgi:hypothetical protein